MGTNNNAAALRSIEEQTVSKELLVDVKLTRSLNYERKTRRITNPITQKTLRVPNNPSNTYQESQRK